MVTNYIGKIIYEEDCLERDKAIEHLKSITVESVRKRQLKGDVLYIEMDGGTINTRKKVNNSSWKENKLEVVFSSNNLVKHTPKDGSPEYWSIGVREYISYFGESDQFLDFLYSVALKHGLEEHRKIVIISDGAKWIKNFKTKYCSDLNCVHILDYTHLKENIFKFANSYIKGTSEDKHKWANALKELIKAGKKDEAIKMAEPYQDQKGDAVNIYSYLKNNYDSIDYPKYKEANYFIGSGAVESGHKSTSKERMCLQGMRWCTDSGQYVLSSKMKYDSGLWHSYVVPLIHRRLAAIPLG